MVMQAGKSVLGALKDLARKVVEDHKDDPIEVRGGDLPPGIEGVAQLGDIGFDIAPKDSKTAPGKPRFFAVGVVVEPEFHTGENGVEIKLQGRQFRQYIPIADTTVKSGKNTGRKISVGDNLGKSLIEMRKLYGLDRDLVTDSGTDDQEDIAAWLKEAAPYFRFATRAGGVTKEYPNPRTFVEWMGGVEDDYVPPESQSGKVEEEAPAATPAPAPRGSTAPKPNGAKPPATQAAPPTRKPVPAAKVPEPEPDPEPEGEAFDYATAELEQLVAMVVPEEPDVQGDDEAGVELRRRASELGFTDEQMDESSVTWQDIADWVAAGPQEEPEPDGGGGEAAAWEPVKGENQYTYQPMDAKTRKPAVNAKKKPLLVSVEVLKVDKAKELVDLKNLTDGKSVYRGIPWGELVQP